MTASLNDQNLPLSVFVFVLTANFNPSISLLQAPSGCDPQRWTPLLKHHATFLKKALFKKSVSFRGPSIEVFLRQGSKAAQFAHQPIKGLELGISDSFLQKMLKCQTLKLGRIYGMHFKESAVVT